MAKKIRPLSCHKNTSWLILTLEMFFVDSCNILQVVPPKGWQLRTKFWKLKNHIWQKVSPVLKFLNKNLSDGTLKLGKIKLKVFLNSKSKKNVKSEKWFCTLPPQLIMPPAPLPPDKKKNCTLPPQLIMRIHLVRCWTSARYEKYSNIHLVRPIIHLVRIFALSTSWIN